MPNPFPGLRPFSPDEAGFFSGRETISDSVSTRIRIAPLTLMFARSGVGKSSFLNCRLIPYLRGDSPVLYWNEWGSDQPERLIRTQMAELLDTPALNEPPVLVLDQFEDVFKSPGSRNPLWDSLAELTNVPDAQVHILISMREEWLGAWHESEDYLPDALNCLLRLRPLTDKELLSAVIAPAQREGAVAFDSELASRLVTDLKRPSPFGLEGLVVEPGLLQLICRRLWAEGQRRQMSAVTRTLYDELGGADQIIREFVWNELGSAGLPKKEIQDADSFRPRFSASDRVLWSGLTRHLIAAQGIKALVSAEQLARALVVTDMGIAGRAVAEDELPYDCTAYLETPIEKRIPPPMELVRWIDGVLSAAVDVGFMKRQRRLVESDIIGTTGRDGTPAAVGVTADGKSDATPDVRPPAGGHIYELSHDALAEIFQIFKIEFEGWVRTKVAKLVGFVVGAIVVLPLVVSVIVLVGLENLGTVLLLLVGGAVVVVIYLVIAYLVAMFMTMVGRLIMHPIYRRMMKGRVPMRRLRGRH